MLEVTSASWDAALARAVSASARISPRTELYSRASLASLAVSCGVRQTSSGMIVPSAGLIGKPCCATSDAASSSWFSSEASCCARPSTIEPIFRQAPASCEPAFESLSHALLNAFAAEPVQPAPPTTSLT